MSAARAGNTATKAVAVYVLLSLAWYAAQEMLRSQWRGEAGTLAGLITAMHMAYLGLTATGLGWMVAKLSEQRTVVASEASYRLLFKANPQPMAVYAVDDLRFLAVNDAAVAHYGYSRAEFLAMTLADIRPPGHAERLNTVIERLRRKAPGGVRNTGVWRHRTKAGREIDVEVLVNSLSFDGRQAHLVLARDVTQRLAADALLRTYQDELSALTQRMLMQERASRLQIAQALHDQIGQGLAIVRMQLDTVARQCRQGGLQGSAAIAERSTALIADAMKAVRNLQCELHPPLLQERGLLAALGGEIDHLQAACPAVHLLLEGTADVPRRWPAEVEYAAFMIAREATANAMRHASASQVRVLVSEDAQRLQLRVDDNGSGMPIELVHGRPGHLGVVGMRERARAIGAHFELACRPQGGTTLLMLWAASTA